MIEKGIKWMSQKLPVDNKIKWKKDMPKFNKGFIKNYDENREKEYILEVDVEYLKKLQNLHNDLPFWPGRMNIKKYSKLVCNLYDKSNYVSRIKSLKQTLNHRLVLKQEHEINQLNQKVNHIYDIYDMNTKLRTEAKNDFEK